MINSIEGDTAWHVVREPSEVRPGERALVDLITIKPNLSDLLTRSEWKHQGALKRILRAFRRSLRPPGTMGREDPRLKGMVLRYSPLGPPLTVDSTRARAVLRIPT